MLLKKYIFGGGVTIYFWELKFIFGGLKIYIFIILSFIYLFSIYTLTTLAPHEFHNSGPEQFLHSILDK